jgi:hypothetical protein
MPIRNGIERILRVVDVPNHLMHFEKAGGRKRLKELTLVGEKGGERELTTGAPAAPPQATRQRQSRRPGVQAETMPDTIEGAGLEQPQLPDLDPPDESMNALEGDAPVPDEVPEMPSAPKPENVQDLSHEEVLQKLKELSEQ